MTIIYSNALKSDEFQRKVAWLNFFMNKSPGKLIFILYLLLFCQAQGFAQSFSLRPDKFSGLEKFAETWSKVQKSVLVRSLDKWLQASGTFNMLLSAAGSKVTILAPTRQQQGENASNKKVIKALTANLILFPHPFFFNQAERIEEFARAVRHVDPDIIFLQEVWDNNSLGLIISRFPDYYSIYIPGLIFNHSGLTILSRFPVESASAIFFAPSFLHNPEEFIAFKGVIFCNAKVGTQTISLANTHLYSSSPKSSYRPNLQQFCQLQHLVSDFPHGTIIGGDLNLLPEELDHLLSGNIERDQCRLPTAGAPERRKKLDYLLIRQTGQTPMTIEARRLEWPIMFSDHSPVFGTIELISHLD